MADAPSGYVRMYHGRSSACLDQILREGHIAPPGYLTTSIADAEEYAAMGGEWDLQRREEAYEAKHGVSPREEYRPDMWDMYFALYPDDQHPVVIAVDVPPDVALRARPDSGAEGGLAFDESLSAEFIAEVVRYRWDEHGAEAAIVPQGAMLPAGP